MSDPTATGTPDAAEPADESQSRGLFSRLIGAPLPTEAERPDDSPQAAGTVAMPGVVNLRKLRVDDVATPKAEIVAIPVSLTLAEVVTAFRESGFSRLPVFDGTLDSPLGLVTLKDLALRYGFGESGGFDLKGMLRPLLYVPPRCPRRSCCRRCRPGAFTWRW